jgi:hypothetical protein
MIRDSAETRSRIGAVVPILVAALLFAVLPPRVALAHGGGPGLDYDPCARYAGLDNYVHFSAYQPQFNRFAEYCGSLPRGGKTLLVFDLLGAELVNAPVAIELVGEGGARRLAIPPRHYPAGVIDVEADLDPGHYDALVTIGDAPTVYHVNFDLAVGAWWYPLITPLIIASLILLIAIGYCLYQARMLAGEMRDGPRAAAHQGLYL